MAMRNFDFSVKTIVVGDSGVGKTCLLLRFVRDAFDETSQPTLGVEFMTRIIQTEKHRIELQLWDTAGQELFRSVTRGYYKGSAGAFLVFDLTSRTSFENVIKWLKDIEDAARADVVKILIGNKSDLSYQRQISKEEAEAFAKEHNMIYFEASAKTGEKVNDAIMKCLEIIDERAESGAFSIPPPSDSIFFEDEKPKEKGCC